MHSALSFVVAPFMIPKLLAFVLLSHRRVNRTDTKKQVCLALLGRQTSYRLLFRPIGCCCCASRSSLPPPPETLAGEERMAAPGPNSCLLAIRTCILSPGDFSSSLQWLPGLQYTCSSAKTLPFVFLDMLCPCN